MTTLLVIGYAAVCIALGWEMHGWWSERNDDRERR